VTTWIRTPEALASLVCSLAGCRAMALDTESDSLHHYFEKVCLVQLATEKGEACLIDPLALKDLAPLAPILADPSVVKVFHGADYDVTTAKRDFGFRFDGLFDTMIAARFLGITEFGLQAILRTEFGVELSKSSQKDDWSRRPLTPVQEAYALADVGHLLPLHARLEERLRTAGRLEWVREECAAVAALEPARRKDDPDAYQKITGAKALPPRGLAILRELHGWRETRATTSDTPAFKIVSSETLLALAGKPPLTREELSRFRGLPPRLQKDDSFFEALRRGATVPEDQLPAIVRKERPRLQAAVRQRVEQLKKWRSQEAVRLNLDVSIVLPQRLLDRVAERPPTVAEDLTAIDGIRKWRIEALGPGIVAALAGPSA
jgi:ribonuclease D